MPPAMPAAAAPPAVLLRSCGTDGVCMQCNTLPPDDRVLVCDACRGEWHMPCLVPPLTAAPAGTWHCPDCHEVEAEMNRAPGGDGGGRDGRAASDAAAGEAEAPREADAAAATVGNGGESDLRARIRAIQSDSSLSDAEKARQRQALVSRQATTSAGESGGGAHADGASATPRGVNAAEAAEAAAACFSEAMKCPICHDLVDRPVTVRPPSTLPSPSPCDLPPPFPPRHRATSLHPSLPVTVRPPSTLPSPSPCDLPPPFPPRHRATSLHPSLPVTVRPPSTLPSPSPCDLPPPFPPRHRATSLHPSLPVTVRPPSTLPSPSPCDLPPPFPPRHRATSLHPSLPVTVRPSSLPSCFHSCARHPFPPPPASLHPFSPRSSILSSCPLNSPFPHPSPPNARQTPCGHNFCLVCFRKWLAQGKRSCAKCRRAVPPDMMKQPRINPVIVAAIRHAKAAAARAAAGGLSTSAPAKPYEPICNEKRPDQAFTTDRAVRKGLSNAASGRIFVTIAGDFFGPITAEYDPERGTGVEVGETWASRLECRQWGAHLPHVAGIAGQSHHGAQSVALSGGYEDDEDNGEWFLYTGSGGRDLSGNKRTNKVHAFDQRFEKSNQALRLSCLKGYPVRVVRSEKERRSSYAPQAGVRYDGVYRIERCWRKKSKVGFLVCRYLFVRCDNSPAPWTSDDVGDSPGRKLPQVAELKQAVDVTERTGPPAWDWIEEKQQWGWVRAPPACTKPIGGTSTAWRSAKRLAVGSTAEAVKVHSRASAFPCDCRPTLSNAHTSPPTTSHDVPSHPARMRHCARAAGRRRSGGPAMHPRQACGTTASTASSAAGARRAPWRACNDGVYLIECCWRKKSAVVRWRGGVWRCVVSSGKGDVVRKGGEGSVMTVVGLPRVSLPLGALDDVGDSPGRKLPQVAELKQAVDVTERTGPPAWDWIVHGGGSTGEDVKKRRALAQKRLAKGVAGWVMGGSGLWVVTDFACLLCGGVLRAPVSTPCQHSFCLAFLQQRFHGQADTRDRSKTAGRSLRAQKIVKQCPAARCTADIADVLSRLQVNHDMADLIAMLLAETNAPDAEEGEDAGEGGEEDGEEGAEGEEDEEDEGKGSRGKDEGKERDGSMEGAGEEGVKEEGGSTGVQVLNAIGAAGSGGGSGEGKAKGAQGEVDGGREGSVDGGKAGGGGALSATSEALVACSSLAAASEGLREVMRAYPCETCWCWEGEGGGVGGEWCFVRRGRGGENGALCEGGEGGRMVLCAKGERGGEWCFVRRGRGGKNGALCEGGEGGRMVLCAKGERGEEWCFVRRGRGGKNGALCEGGEGGRVVLCAKGERGEEWCFVRRGRGGKNGALCEGGEGGRMVLCAKGERGEEWCFVRRGRGGKNGALCEGGEGGRMVLCAKGERGEEWCFVRRGRGGKNGALCEGGEGGRMVLCAKGERGEEWCFVRRGRGGKNGALCEGGEGGRMVLCAKGERGEEWCFVRRGRGGKNGALCEGGEGGRMVLCAKGERGEEWCFVRRGRGGKNGALCEGGEGGRMVLCAKGERGGEWCFVRRGRGGENGALCEGGEGGRMVLCAKGERGEEWCFVRRGRVGKVGAEWWEDMWLCVVVDGLLVDGLLVDGLLVDGLLVDGLLVDGLPVDGLLVDGLLVDGLLVDGLLVDGLLVDGLLVDGLLVDGSSLALEVASDQCWWKRRGASVWMSWRYLLVPLPPIVPLHFLAVAPHSPPAPHPPPAPDPRVHH
ncbi:unnamed protein product [Closterium sp. Naga37s-1]|nr:unnamed protein product [Closterium sp. Naga37s-1]